MIKEAKGIEKIDKRFQLLISKDEKESLFLKEYFAAILSYSAQRVPEISDNCYQLDDAMRAGYVWDFGPFQYWDLIGFDKGISLINECGETLPKWINDMKASGANCFYKYENGEKKYYDLSTHSYKKIPGSDAFIILDSYRQNSPVIKNSECSVHDIGDGVLCLEFQSKSNAIGEGIGRAMLRQLNWLKMRIGLEL